MAVVAGHRTGTCRTPECAMFRNGKYARFGAAQPGSSNVHRVAVVRGSDRVLPSSAHFRCFTLPWLLASVIAAAGGCTLTDKPFEPTPIDNTETQSEPTLPTGSIPSNGMPMVEQETGLATPANSEEGVPNVRAPTTQASMLEPGT